MSSAAPQDVAVGTGVGTRPKLSIVTTLYRSAGDIQEFYERAVATAEKVTDHFELVMVNDGSPDSSLERALELHRSDPRIVVVDLARNFGHHRAIMTGLGYATGELVFLIDSDLEEPPELLEIFYERYRQGDCEVVFGVQENRRGGVVERISGSLFFTIVESLSDETLPRNLVTARLMSRDYVRALVRYRDRAFAIAQLWALAGHRQVAVPVQKLPRSSSSYSFTQRLTLAVSYVTTTSTKLLYLILYLGLAIATLSALLVAFFGARYLIADIGVDGWTSLMVSVWFFGGLTIVILGVLGVYTATILTETKRRPYATVRKVHRSRGSAVGA